jgi:hypothetical protein
MFDRPEGDQSPVPDPPDEVAHIWIWFTQLMDWRTPGFNMPGALSHCEMQAWAKLMHIELYPAEVDALRRLDRAYRDAVARKSGLITEPVPVTRVLSDAAEIAKQQKKEVKSAR